MQVYAHRGASGEYPENTLLAFEQAIAQQSDGIEFDVQHAKDGLVIAHDRFLIHNEETFWLADHNIDTLKTLDLGNNQRIPTLIESLKAIKGRCACNIELKQLHELGEVKAILSHTLESGLLQPEQIVVSSFDHHLLPEVQGWQLGIETAAIIASNPLKLADFASDMAIQAIHADVHTVTPQLIDSAHEQGLAVRVYTVDQQRDISHLLQWGADAIFSNFPARAKRVIESLRTA